MTEEIVVQNKGKDIFKATTFLFGFLVILLILALGFVYQKLLVLKGKCPQATVSTGKSVSCESIKFAPLPQSKRKSYPIVVDHNLILLPIDEKVEGGIKVDSEIESGNGAIEYGNTSPLPAPNLQTIAYIKNRFLWLVSADGNRKVSISDKLPTSYISGWSTDSRYLIFSSLGESISQMFEGMGIEDTRQFPKRYLPVGMYLVDTQKGEVSWLSPISNFVTWLDSNKIIVKDTLYGSVQNNVVFDVENYLADTKTLRDSLSKYFYPQFSVSQAQGKWALALGQPGGTAEQKSFARIVIADYPNVEGKTIGEGNWADIQWPILAPDGNRLIYQKYGVVNGPTFVQYWDGRESKRLVEGHPIMWVDNNRFIYNVFITKQEKVFLYDLQSLSSIPLN